MPDRSVRVARWDPSPVAVSSVVIRMNPSGFGGVPFVELAPIVVRHRPGGDGGDSSESSQLPGGQGATHGMEGPEDILSERASSRGWPCRVSSHWQVLERGDAQPDGEPLPADPTWG